MKKFDFRVVFLVLVGGLFLGGCSIKEPHTTDTMSGLSTNDSYAKIKEANIDYWKNNYAEEKTSYRNGTPRFGLALSGGGTRSASFSIGVLKALEENGILSKLDLISSVSGGSYASYWLFQNYYYMHNAEDYSECIDKYNIHDVFRTRDWYNNPKYMTKSFDIYDRNTSDKTNLAQTYLEYNSNLLSKYEKSNSWTGTKNVSSKFLAWLGAYPLHVVGNGLFNWDVNVNPMRRFYQNGIERTYGLISCSKKTKKFLNPDWGENVPINVDKELTLSDLQKLIKESNKSLPIPIINATAGYGGSGVFYYGAFPMETTMSQTVFEFTPFRVGSRAYGYKNISLEEEDETIEVTFPKSVSISGAAVDAQFNDNAFKSAGLGLINMNLGYNMTNYNHKGTNAFQYILPFPFYYFDSGYKQDKDAYSIYLSDGGHSDNLGVFSLVRRGVKNIIIVDAENDKKTDFDGVKKLRQALYEELNVNFTLDTKKITNVFDTKVSVLKGKIGPIPGLEGDDYIDVTYIKLSIDKSRMISTHKRPYPKSVMKYYQDKRVKKTFPHTTTADTKYQPEQFRAYRDLGYDIAKSVRLKNNKFTIKNKAK